MTFVKETVQLPGVQFASDLSSDNVTSSYGVVSAGKYSMASAAADVLSINGGEKGFVANFAYELSKHRCYERESAGLASMVAY